MKATISEAQFQRQVYQFAKLNGWKVVWFRPARVKRGGKETYETPVGGDGRGWPDVVMVKEGRPVVFCELKSATGKLRPEQEEWLQLLRLTPSQVFVWRPNAESWAEIERVLGNGSVTTKGVM